MISSVPVLQKFITAHIKKLNKINEEQTIIRCLILSVAHVPLKHLLTFYLPPPLIYSPTPDKSYSVFVPLAPLVFASRSQGLRPSQARLRGSQNEVVDVLLGQLASADRAEGLELPVIEDRVHARTTQNVPTTG